jgi:hypothetical protein
MAASNDISKSDGAGVEAPQHDKRLSLTDNGEMLANENDAELLGTVPSTDSNRCMS